MTVEYAEITESPGAGHYRRRDSEVGGGLKRSLSARHREGIHVGYPNSLIAPVDTMGQSRNLICNETTYALLRLPITQALLLLAHICFVLSLSEDQNISWDCN